MTGDPSCRLQDCGQEGGRRGVPGDADGDGEVHLLLGGGRGGVLNSTLFYTLHLYIQGWTYHEMGYASAMAWVLLIIIGVVTAIVFRSTSWWVTYGVGE